jgi:hypothetical protein
MTALSKGDSERSGLSVGAGVFLALASGVSALWFSRSYYFHSDRAGWGHRNQPIFLWVSVISAAVSLVLVVITGIRSVRFRLAVGSAGTLTVVLALLLRYGGHGDLPYAVIPLFPGILAYMMAFGLHSDAGKWVDFLWMFGVNTVFYATIVAGIIALLNRRKRLHES